MKIKKIISLFGILLITSSLFAQLQKANRYYDRFEYAYAIPLYLKVIEDGKKGVDEAITKLAYCYGVTRDFAKAEKWYAKAFTLDSLEAIDYLHYASVLQSNEKFDEAKKWFLTFDSLVPDDDRGERYVAFINEIVDYEPEDDVQIENVDILNSEFSDFAPVFYKNGLVYSSDRPEGKSGEKKFGWTGAYYLDLFYAKNNNEYLNVSAFDSPGLLSEKLDKTYHDGIASFNAKENVVYFTRSYPEKGTRDSTGYYTSTLKIYFSELRYNKWRGAKQFIFNNEEYSIGHPSLIHDSVLYFVSDMPGGMGGKDIYISYFINRKWTKPQNLGNIINTKGDEMFPYIFNDTLLFFASDGHAGYGGLDIFKSVKRFGKWQAPQNIMAPINSTYDDFGIIYDTSLARGYFSSNRKGGKGGDDIYYFKRTPKLKPVIVYVPPTSINIRGVVKDAITMTPLPFATVFLWDKNSDSVKVIKTNANGEYMTRVKIGTPFTIKGMGKGYNSDTLNTRIVDTVDVGLHDILLSKFQINQVFRIENIYYDYDKWNIRPDAAFELDKVIRFLNEHPEIQIELGSHTDARGSFTYNQSLSQKRARSAVDYILANGINNTRITAKGYGESLLVNHCKDGVKCSAELHQENRRTEIKITGIIENEAKKMQDSALDKYPDGQTLTRDSFDPEFFNIFDTGQNDSENDK